MGRRGYNQVCQIFLLDCKCCFKVFKSYFSLFLCLYFVTGRKNHYFVRIFTRKKCQGRSTLQKNKN